MDAVIPHPTEEEGDRKSNSGFLIKFDGGLVIWGTRKQTCVTLSSTEAEFVALAEGCQELLWMRKLLEELDEQPGSPIVMWENNQSCIKMVESDRLQKRSKHIDTKHAFTRDLQQQGIIGLRYLPTDKMDAELIKVKV